MAAKYKNGAILWTMCLDNHVLNFHENGHILQRVTDGWRQWAIVPRYGMGSLADYLESRGWERQDNG